MFEDNIKAILEEMWPTLLLITFVLLSMRIVYIFKHHEKVVLYKELLSYIFVIYIMCLFYVVTFQDVSWSSSNFIPFKEIFRYKVGTKLFFKNVLGNMIMFIPYGFFISYFLKLKKVYSASLMILLTSVTIEVTQLLIGRVFDVDDIMLNLLGGIIGFAIYYIISKIKSKLPDFLKKPFIYNIIMLILIGTVISYLVLVVKVGM